MNTMEASQEAPKDSYINKITLEYLLNPSIHLKTNNSNELLENDIKFYKNEYVKLQKR